MVRKVSRRSFLALSAASAGTVLGSRWIEPAIAQLSGSSGYPVQTGDVTANRAVIWTRGTRESQLIVEVSPSPQFGPNTRRVTGLSLNAATDFTGSVDVQGLRPDTTYYYRLAAREGRGQFQGVGQFRTAAPPGTNRSVRFVWVADLAGQGWGRNPELKIRAFDGETIKGGYVIFDVMRKFNPDFAVFCGDMIYADNAIPPTLPIPEAVGGGIWVNEPAKNFVAINLEEFRTNWKYNLGDEKLQRFLAQTPVYVQWDDHEVTNNWYPSEVLTASPYNGISADVLASRAKQAFFEYNPIRGDEIFRKFRHGKHLELFLLDERSFRGSNPANNQPFLEMLGQEQLDWLKQSLKASSATWKVVANHDPFAIVTGGAGDWDAWSQGSPEVLGREAQLRELLTFIKANRIKNVVFITADVHFAAAVECSPERSLFKDFYPFWEFVVGPINAGAFGPGQLDPSFGAEYKFVRSPGTQNLPQNLPPPHLQFFGLAEIDGNTADLTVQIRSITGELVYEKVLNPED